jgi:hypothetical protein
MPIATRRGHRGEGCRQLCLLINRVRVQHRRRRAQIQQIDTLEVAEVNALFFAGTGVHMAHRYEFMPAALMSGLNIARWTVVDSPGIIERCQHDFLVYEIGQVICHSATQHMTGTETNLFFSQGRGGSLQPIAGQGEHLFLRLVEAPGHQPLQSVFTP